MVDRSTDAWVLASSALDAILLIAEEMEKPDSDICCDSRDGAVEISNENTVYLVSWHEPSAQLWVASPKSGSVRFSYDRDSSLWRDDRSGKEILAFVKQEIHEIFGMLEK